MFSEAERIIQTETETTSLPIASSNIRLHYRLESVVTFIINQKAFRIALQFPDHLLVDTPMVVSELQTMLTAANSAEGGAAVPSPASGGASSLPPTSPFSLFVLSDNTFGACCPDEITAAHYSAQCIIHFGYACMSRTNRLPVMYVAERGEFDVAAISAALTAVVESNTNDSDGGEGSAPQVVIVLTQPARYLRSHLEEIIGSMSNTPAQNSNIIIADRPTPTQQGEGEESAATTVAEEASWLIAGDAIPRLSSGSNSNSCQQFIFVGSADSPVLAQLAMICRYNDSIEKEGSTLQIVTPTTASETAAQRSIAASKALRTVDQRLQKRMYNIEVLKGCGSVGILVCTLAIKNYRESAEILSKLIRKSGRRCYIVYIGHINEFKIANFSDSIDAFVVISCPHSRQAQFPQKDDNFMKPLCSPIEMLIALGHAGFDDPQAYTTGFAECCSKAAEVAGLCAAAEGSLRITNATASAVVKDAADSDGEDGAMSSALLVRGGMHGGAVSRFAQRSYKGLEAKLGQTAVQTEVVQGKDGIAKGYVAEKMSQPQGEEL